MSRQYPPKCANDLRPCPFHLLAIEARSMRIQTRLCVPPSSHTQGPKATRAGGRAPKEAQPRTGLRATRQGPKPSRKQGVLDRTLCCRGRGRSGGLWLSSTLRLICLGGLTLRLLVVLGHLFSTSTIVGWGCVGGGLRCAGCQLDPGKRIGGCAQLDSSKRVGRSGAGSRGRCRRSTSPHNLSLLEHLFGGSLKGAGRLLQHNAVEFAHCRWCALVLWRTAPDECTAFHPEHLSS